jgi:hypothetical protein
VVSVENLAARLPVTSLGSSLHCIVPAVMKEDAVNDEIKPGDILFQEGTLLPEALQIVSAPCMPGWRLAKDVNGYEAGRKVQKVGWTFFCLAGEIKSIVFGTSDRSMVLRGIKRILANPRSKKFNSLEITRIVSKRLLGIRRMSVSAQSRHIQQSLFLRCGDEGRPGQTQISSIWNPAWGPTSTREVVREETDVPVRAAASASV